MKHFDRIVKDALLKCRHAKAHEEQAEVIAAYVAAGISCHLLARKINPSGEMVANLTASVIDALNDSIDEVKATIAERN